MREKEILRHRSARVLTLVWLGLAGACKPDPSATSDAQASKTAAEPGPSDPAEPGPDPAEPLEPTQPKLDPAVESDPERPAKLADLDALCKAVDHDYDDGTLSDYYADVDPQTEWGKAQRDVGNKSMQPGRLLERAVAELSPGAKDPALSHCRKLLDYLDDVE